MKLTSVLFDDDALKSGDIINVIKFEEKKSEKKEKKVRKKSIKKKYKKKQNIQKERGF